MMDELLRIQIIRRVGLHHLDVGAAYASRVAISTPLRVMLKTGVDIQLCPFCKRGRMIIQHTLIMYNGELRDITTFRNRGSPISRYQNEHPTQALKINHVFG